MEIIGKSINPRVRGTIIRFFSMNFCKIFVGKPTDGSDELSFSEVGRCFFWMFGQCLMEFMGHNGQFTKYQGTLSSPTHIGRVAEGARFPAGGDVSLDSSHGCCWFKSPICLQIWRLPMYMTCCPKNPSVDSSSTATPSPWIFSAPTSLVLLLPPFPL